MLIASNDKELRSLIFPSSQCIGGAVDDFQNSNEHTHDRNLHLNPRVSVVGFPYTGASVPVLKIDRWDGNGTVPYTEWGPYFIWYYDTNNGKVVLTKHNILSEDRFPIKINNTGTLLSDNTNQHWVGSVVESHFNTDTNETTVAILYVVFEFQQFTYYTPPPQVDYTVTTPHVWLRMLKFDGSGNQISAQNIDVNNDEVSWFPIGGKIENIFSLSVAGDLVVISIKGAKIVSSNPPSYSTTSTNITKTFVYNSGTWSEQLLSVGSLEGDDLTRICTNGTYMVYQKDGTTSLTIVQRNGSSWTAGNTLYSVGSISRMYMDGIHVVALMSTGDIKTFRVTTTNTIANTQTISYGTTHNPTRSDALHTGLSIRDGFLTWTAGTLLVTYKYNGSPSFMWELFTLQNIAESLPDPAGQLRNVIAVRKCSFEPTSMQTLIKTTTDNSLDILQQANIFTEGREV